MSYKKGKDLKQCGSCLTYHYIRLALSTCVVCDSHKDIVGIKPRGFVEGDHDLISTGNLCTNNKIINKLINY